VGRRPPRPRKQVGVSLSGVVARVDLQGVVVLDDAGALTWATVRKRLMDPGARLGNAIVVGDRVTFEAGEDDGPAVVTGIAPRRNRFERAASGAAASGRTQITAANLDQVLAVAALMDPPLREGLLDRFAVTCEALGLPLLVAFSKADLIGPAEVTAARALYERAGYPTYVLAALEGRGVPELGAALAGKRTLVIGHSGVGKSTLLNVLVPSLGLKIGEVNARTGRGRHTTTAATLVRIAEGPPPTEVIDTPGVRAFGLLPFGVAGLARLFPEWRGRGPCRFADCAHRDEPGCALKEAVAEGAIGAERYASYVRLRDELEHAAPRRSRGTKTRR